MNTASLLENSLKTLQIAVKFSSAINSEQELLLRDGAIQRFEYTFELAIKTLERFLKEISISEIELITVTYNDLIRIGAEKQLIRNPEKWFLFRQARNKTSHAYSSIVADEVFEVIPDFIVETEDLLSKLKEIENRH